MEKLKTSIIGYEHITKACVFGKVTLFDKNGNEIKTK